MRKQIFTARSIAIIGCVALAAALLLGWFVLWLARPEGLLTMTGSGGQSVGETSVNYISSDHRIVLVIWTDMKGTSGGETGTGFLKLTSRAKGFSSSADGRRIDWEWKMPQEKGGDFRINGKPYDLADGTLILVSTKGGEVRVTQLDVDLSKVQPRRQGFEALAKGEPRIAQFVAEAAGKK